ncbi:MAG TPA: FGGY family carbohydrate kinase [Prolixibacteraceae bacterium]|nr:FGGY family carbohydrate kinase [Prolixibacteraceae bacterium]
MYLLGIDIGSSSVKASILNGETGEIAGTSFYPKNEMAIVAKQSGWAEQQPELWWKNLKLAILEAKSLAKISGNEIVAIGISYQMHGLVIVDKQQNVLRPSIIWCDSRATEIGNKAFDEIGNEKCLNTLLNSPGNFTASKLKWVKENEPSVYKKIDRIMLPGDYIAMRLTGEIRTTASGLSEGMFWDFRENEVSELVLNYYGFSKELIPELVDTFGIQGQVSTKIANELGLKPGTPVSYRAGDQPNNALSLNVLNPGEIATTAGTSGVVYGVSGDVKYDPQSRVNTFAHVNHSAADSRLGVLLCINGTGILNSWLNKYVGNKAFSYDEMNRKASDIAIGSEGLSILPFGNGAERVLGNKNIGAQISGIGFNIHTEAHLFRAAQEGIVFSFKYGMEIMEQIGINAKVIRAGKANMFLSPVFRETLAGVSGATIELYNTDGSVGAARGAGIGSGYYASAKDAFADLKKLETVIPDTSKSAQYEEAYQNWKIQLKKYI